GAVELRADPVYVGRAVECAIRTEDAMVSRKHSMIRFDQGRYWVEDLGSSNGTHVNDVKIQRQVLSHNDVVRCGSLWLRYIEEGPMYQPQPQPQSQPQPRPPSGGMAAPTQAADLGFASTVATQARQSNPGLSSQSGAGASPRPAQKGPGDPPSVVVN